MLIAAPTRYGSITARCTPLLSPTKSPISSRKSGCISDGLDQRRVCSHCLHRRLVLPAPQDRAHRRRRSCRALCSARIIGLWNVLPNTDLAYLLESLIGACLVILLFAVLGSYLRRGIARIFRRRRA